MLQLDIERINANSPYKVFSAKGRGCIFATDYGVHYSATFEEDELLQSSTAYHFALTNLDNKPSPRDNKLRGTIVAIIHEFFESNQYTMLYICETGDGRQDMRNRLFAHWFRSFATEENFIYRQMEVQEENIKNYITMILRRDNPDAALILEEWDSSVLAFSEKPEN